MNMFLTIYVFRISDIKRLYFKKILWGTNEVKAKFLKMLKSYVMLI